MSTTIIVARFNEDIEWTKQFSNVIIYNKGEPLNNGITEICLKNVGREGHSYFQYIYDNYDNLNTYTIFLQGYPFDHSPNLVENIKKCTDSDAHFVQLCELVLNCKLSGCRYHPNLPLRDVYNYVFDTTMKTDIHFTFGAGAQFRVSKESILKRPRDFYLKIIKLQEHSVNPIEAYIMERLYGFIFT